jgi:hypothetical protein
MDEDLVAFGFNHNVLKIGALQFFHLHYLDD